MLHNYCAAHNHCDHDVKYCKKCDVPYCAKCGKEWKAQTWWINPYSTGYPTITYTTDTTSVSSDNITLTTAHTH